MFEVGDVVRLKKADLTDRNNGFQVGDIGVVREVDAGDYFITWFRHGHHTLWFYAKQPEKVNDPEV